jgi:MFS family permease
LALALISGAAFAALTGKLAHRFGRRRTLVAASVIMAASGVLLADTHDVLATVAGLFLGTVSAGTQEVGPFAALEQTLIADAAGRDATAVFGRYNLVGAFMIAIGAAIPSLVSSTLAPWGYGVSGLVLGMLYATLPEIGAGDEGALATPSISGNVSRAVEKLAALFAVDAFAGGIVVQSFLAYWFVVRFHADSVFLGVLFFSVNTLGALSLLLAAPLARRIGLVRTMVYTHLPSHLLLAAVPLMPNLESAAVVLIARFAISQMDQPVRQALVMAIVPPADRPRAAGLTNAVRPAAAAFGPLISGFATASAALGLPFYLAGGIKTAYDLAVLAQFHDIDAKIASAQTT